MKGLADLIARLVSRLVKLLFIACERLAAPLILGCDFMDRFVEAIYPKKKNVEMNDGTTVPITRKTLRRPPVAALVTPQDGRQHHGRESPEIRIVTVIVLPPDAQMWISVVGKLHGLAVVHPHDELYPREKIFASNGVVQVKPERAFRILMVNLSKKPKTLTKEQIVGTLLPHPTTIFNTPVTLGQVLNLDEVENPVVGEKNEALSETDNEKPEKGEEKSQDIMDVDVEHVDLRYQSGYAICCASMPECGMVLSGIFRQPNIGAISRRKRNPSDRHPIEQNRKRAKRKAKKSNECSVQEL